jgi:hypothetical protein
VFRESGMLIVVFEVKDNITFTERRGIAADTVFRNGNYIKKSSYMRCYELVSFAQRLFKIHNIMYSEYLRRSLLRGAV